MCRNFPLCISFLSEERESETSSDNLKSGCTSTVVSIFTCGVDFSPSSRVPANDALLTNLDDVRER